jgi:catechol 2,3-dioxygenase-like lactoylglutathione lyase family enzyme
MSLPLPGTGILESTKETHMEHIIANIAKLLHDFENGFMNRRQLVHSLAFAAVAAAPAGVALAQNPAQNSSATPAAGAPAPAHSPAFKTVELDHISFQVKDYRVTRDFYADLMGMEVTNDNGRSQVEMKFGNSTLLARNRRPPADGATPAASAAAPAGNRPPTTALVDHIAYRIYNWDTDQVKDELMRRGLAAATLRPDTGGGIPNYSSFHVSDPDGFNLQISGWAGANDSVSKKK